MPNCSFHSSRYPLFALVGASLAVTASLASAASAAPPLPEGAVPIQTPDDPPDPVKVSARPGEGFRVASGDTSLTLGIRSQLRATLEDNRATEDDATFGLRLQRVRVTAKATVGDPKTQVSLDMDLAQLGPAAPARPSPLLDAFVEFSHLRDLTLRVGQYKVPFLRETIQADSKLEFVDLSLTQRRFSLDRDVGLDVGSRDLFGSEGRLRYNLGVYSGQGARSFSQQPFGLLYLARAEVLPLGGFDDYSQGDLARSDELGVALGGAFGYVHGAHQRYGTHGGAFNDAGTADYQLATADLVLKFAGVHLYGAVAYRGGDRDGGGAVDDAGAVVPVEDAHQGWGFVGQLSYLIPSTSALVAGRYAASIQGDDSALADEREAGGGVSYFFSKHAIKLQADALRVWQPEAGFSKGTDQVRLQLQIAL